MKIVKYFENFRKSYASVIYASIVCARMIWANVWSQICSCVAGLWILIFFRSGFWWLRFSKKKIDTYLKTFYKIFFTYWTIYLLSYGCANITIRSAKLTVLTYFGLTRFISIQHFRSYSRRCVILNSHQQDFKRHYFSTDSALKRPICQNLYIAKEISTALITRPKTLLIYSVPQILLIYYKNGSRHDWICICGHCCCRGHNWIRKSR